jgi:dTDP-4-amino-4,6-dideoxygalactose transaminase
MTTAADKQSPIRTKPLPAMPKRYDGRELEYLKEALSRNNLFYTQPDGLVSRMLQRAREVFGTQYALSASSGSAALHAAVGAAGVEVGAEVITSPITDMGSLIGILYQNAIPVFADVDDRTYNLTAQSIEAAITPRTQAVIAVHLAGAPCPIDEIARLCKSKNIKLIEDCAQSFGCRYQSRHVGGFGDLGCFSFNEYKHLSTGDGGIVVTNDQKLYGRAHNYADKCYDRLNQGDRLAMLCPNYRMTELQGAVGLAQFDRLDGIVKTRNTLGNWLNEQLATIPGILPPKIVDGGQSSYWFYMIRVDEQKLGIDRDEFVRRLNLEGIAAGAGYIERPIYQEPVFANRNFFGGGVWPAEKLSGREYDYRKVHCPNADKVLKTSIRLSLHEGFTKDDAGDYVKAIRKVAATPSPAGRVMG